MKQYSADHLRNVVLLGHSGSGKTSLAEAMLFDTGAINRMGRVEDGTTVADFDEEEHRRGISINTAVVPVEWNDYKINALDAPGFMDFLGDIKGALAVADSAVILVDASAGVEVGTELVWGYTDEAGLPRLVFVNKIDRENVRFDRVLEQLEASFNATFVPIQIPIGEGGHFQGLVDLVSMKVYTGEDKVSDEVPDAVADQVDTFRRRMMESAAENDDELLLKYLDGEELTGDEIKRGFQAGVAAGSIVPVLIGSATHNHGVRRLMDAIIEYLPSPRDASPYQATNPATGEDEMLDADPSGPLAAFVFKTVADPYVGKLTFYRVFSGTMQSDTQVYNPRSGSMERLGQLYVMRGKEQIPVAQITAGDIGGVAKLDKTVSGDTLCDRDHPLVIPPPEYPTPLYSVALTPKTQADTAKLGPTLSRLADEDPTLRWHQEPSTKELILSGMGETHIDVAIRRMEDKFGVGVNRSVPKVPYRETVTRTATAKYRHKKQTGGAGQFAEVHMRVEPLERGEGFEYKSEVFGGAISQSFIPSIEKGVKQVLEQGAIAGYPVVDVKAVVYDGKEHPVDSKDIAFQIAGREAFKLAVHEAGPVLLEPIMNVRVIVPVDMMGDILGDMSTRRGRVLGTNQEGRKAIIEAQVPLAEMQRYATDLRSMTQGRGIYFIEFSHYEEVPQHVAQEIIEKAKKEREEN
ncbi:MAG: elongation factor G [Chloroflexi bacterium]|nr:MAG: elongation factor G [Chloroflexota bacterium]